MNDSLRHHPAPVGARVDLLEPTVRLHGTWLEARAEWGGEPRQPGMGLRADDHVDTPAGFSTWVQRLRLESDHSIPVRAGLVHATYWWIVEGDTYLGAITLRHALNDFLLAEGGHIGYSVRPTAQRRGLASWSLERVLNEARLLGMRRVLVTCDDSNLASARTIEKNAGVLEDVRRSESGPKRRYWITL